MERYYLRVGIYDPYYLEVSIQHLSTHLDWMGIPMKTRIWGCHPQDSLGFRGWALFVSYSD